MIYCCNMLWCGVIVVVDDIEKICLCLFMYLFCYCVGVEIVFIKGVGQFGVWVCGDVVFCNL